MNALERLSRQGGIVILDGTTDYTDQNIDSLYPREDTIINNLEAKDPEGTSHTDVKNTWNWDGTLKVTDELIPPAGWVITRVKLTSGSLQALNI